MSVLKETYDRFFATPSLDDLHEEVTLTYISSGTTIAGANEVVKYLLTSRHDVQITETVLSWHAGYGSLTVEVAADCNFKNGPSWIAPGVDGNLLDGMVVKLPVVKTIVFHDGKIRSIRVFWDQATVLKQLEIVGSRGRGWPITDGPRQIELITKTVVPEVNEAPAPPPQPAAEPASPPTPVMSPPTPIAAIPSPEKPKPKAHIKTPSQATATPRRTYSITGDIDLPPPPSASRLPRAGWQSHLQSVLLVDEANVPLKEASPVRLPRAGQAPKREFSFSNLAEVYKSQEPVPTSKQATHHEVDEEEEEPEQPPPVKKTSKAAQHIDLFASPAEAEDNTPQITKASQHYKARGPTQELIFHDADETPKGKSKPSIGGGTGGRVPEETIFFESEEDPNRVHPKKSPITRRDQQVHFTFSAEDPSTPVKPRSVARQHFSIEGTPDPMEAEYRARALQRKEVNHFRPDTIPHFEFVDKPEDEPIPKKENTDGMNKLLKTMGRNWMMGVDSPTVSRENRFRQTQLSKKDLTPHFSFEPSGDEKENGQTKQGKRMTMPAIKSEEKEWWET